MGTGFSLPVPDPGDNRGYVCMVIRPTDRFRLLHASNEVERMVTNAAR